MNTTAALDPVHDRDNASRDGTTTRIAVWDLPTRVFHWSLALSFAVSFVTAESERWRDVHAMFGYTVLGLIAFRLVWGLIGSRHARFSAFVAGPSRLAAYAKSLFSGQPARHVGHNPAGAVAILLLLGLGLLVGATGHATFNDIGGDWLTELHEVAANAMLAVVVVHLLGVVASSVLHRENLVGAMISGNKAGHPGEAITKRHRVIGIALLVAVLGFWGAWAMDSATGRAGLQPDTVLGAPAAAGEGSIATRRGHDDD